MLEKTSRLKEIAFALGLSVNTISRALRDCDDISEKTKKLVREKAYELGYIPNSVSQYIKRNGKKLIAIFIKSFKNDYANIITDKLINRLAEIKIDTTIIYLSGGIITSDAIKQAVSQRVDGIITFIEPNEEIVDLAKFNKMPILFLNSSNKNLDISMIKIDNKEGAAYAANYMCSIRSQSDKYLYISKDNIYDSRERYRYIRENLEKIYENKNLDFAYIDYRDLDSNKIMSLINNEYMNVFCFNDELAYYYLAYLHKIYPNVRKAFPNLHIIGWDAISTAMPSATDLTSIAFSYDEVVENAIRITKIMIKDPLHKEEITIPTFLHIQVNS